jgi:hypothetical protein
MASVDPRWSLDALLRDYHPHQGWLDEFLPADWFDRAEQELGGWNGIIADELCPWFADCWQAADGPAVFSPALLFFHGYHRDQYDLERRCWLPAAS